MFDVSLKASCFIAYSVSFLPLLFLTLLFSIVFFPHFCLSVFFCLLSPRNSVYILLHFLGINSNDMRERSRLAGAEWIDFEPHATTTCLQYWQETYILFSQTFQNVPSHQKSFFFLRKTDLWHLFWHHCL